LGGASDLASDFGVRVLLWRFWVNAGLLLSVFVVCSS
jgi:hypothetical protein